MQPAQEWTQVLLSILAVASLLSFALVAQLFIYLFIYYTVYTQVKSIFHNSEELQVCSYHISCILARVVFLHQMCPLHLLCIFLHLLFCMAIRLRLPND